VTQKKRLRKSSRNSFGEIIAAICQNPEINDFLFKAIDITYGMVYCYLCRDYQYDEEFEEISNNYFNREKLFRFGKPF
jgi:hypothetical protein